MSTRRVFERVDPHKLVRGETDCGAGEVNVPPGVNPVPIGLSYDAEVGRFRVRFLFAFGKDGEPGFAAFWSPSRPKKLKPALIRRFRRERRLFTEAVARQFDLGVYIIDRLGGAPRVTELVFPDGAVDPVDFPFAERTH